MLAHLIAHAHDALIADMRRVYGVNLSELTPLEAAPLARYLPDGSMVWRELDMSNAWTTTQHLLACIVDQLQMWMWAQADPKRRGRKPQPLQRPGASTQKRSDSTAMSIAELDKYFAQDFTDI